jgi:Cys-rich repeat protein
VERVVVIAGLVSCTDDSDCPNGQTCQPNLMCQ